MKNRENQTLTRSEMKVMDILWNMPDGGSVADVIERYPDPRPAYTTVATFLTILDKKVFVAHRKAGTGRTLQYYPLVSRDEYTRRAMSEVKDNFFGGSVSSLLHFFVREKELTREEIEELLKMVED